MCSKIKNLDEYISFIYMYGEDTSRRADNLMKMWFKCINMVDYGLEVFYIWWNNQAM